MFVKIKINIFQATYFYISFRQTDDSGIDSPDHSDSECQTEIKTSNEDSQTDLVKVKEHATQEKL